MATGQHEEAAIAMSDVRLCPACGARRMGAFRYCLGCRLDYDTLGIDTGVAVGTAGPSWPDPDAARAAIRSPGRGAPPGRRPVRGRRGAGPRPSSIAWMTNAVASIGIVTLIGVAFGSTGLTSLPAVAPPVGTGAGVVRPEVATASSEDPTADPVTARPDGTAAAPASGPTARPGVPATRVVAAPVEVTAVATTLRGSGGTTTWSALAFKVAEARLAWSATSDRGSGCILRWTLERPKGQPVRGSVRVTGRSRGADQRVVRLQPGTGRLVVRTDCAAWSLVLGGTREQRGGG